MSQGYFKVDRSIFDNPIWNSEPFTKAQAWVDLFGKANHSDGYFFKRGIKIDVKRGQTGRSERTLSDDWKWSRGKVKRFLNWLKKEEMVELKQNHKTTIITICNYESFQGSKNDSSTTNSTTSSTTDEPQTNLNNNVKNVKKKEIYTPAFEKWFESYPKRNGRKVGKNLAFPFFKKISQTDWIDLKIATQNYALECNGLPKDPERFLKKDFWKDFIGKTEQEKSKSIELTEEELNDTSD